jgi:hypothetical protein
VKTENPSSCVTVNCKVYGDSGSAVLPVVPSCANKVSINPNIQSKTHPISQAQTPVRVNIYIYIYIAVHPCLCVVRNYEF